MKRFLKLSFLVFISVVLLGSSQVNARDLKITASAKTIYVKQRIQMKVKPSSQKGSIKWKTTDRKIATVSQSGIVTGKKAGKVKVYAISTDNGKKKASYTIRVKEFKERSLQVKSRIVSYSMGFIRVCQEKCVSFIKFSYRQFSKLPVLYLETVPKFEVGVCNK